MNNPVNAYAGLPVYRSLREQTYYRHDGPALNAPTSRLLPFQFQTSGTVEEVRAVFMEAQGDFAVSFGFDSFDRHQIDGGNLVYTFRADYFGDLLPPCEGYMAVSIGNNTVYTERMRLHPFNFGQRVRVTMTSFGENYTLTSAPLEFATPTADRWEYLEAGQWTDLPTATGDTITISRADVYDTNSGQPAVVKIRRTITTDARTYRGLYGLNFGGGKTLLTELPQAPERQTDWWCIEWWNDRDDFGFLYEKGFRQRLYVEATFDGPVIEEQDTLITRPDGYAFRSSAVVKPRHQFTMSALPDYLVGPLEGMSRHDNIRLTRQSDGVTFTCREGQFEYSQGADPLSVEGRFSFVKSIFYLAGQKQSLNAADAPPTTDPTEQGQDVSNDNPVIPDEPGPN